MGANRSFTVLVVDVDPFVIEAISDGLLSRGFEVIKAWNARNALSILLTEKVDVVVAHGHMRGTRGSLGFTAEIAIAWPDLAVVAMTSCEHAGCAYEPGRVSTLRCPFNLATLLVAVAKAHAMVVIKQGEDLTV